MSGSHRQGVWLVLRLLELCRSPPDSPGAGQRQERPNSLKMPPDTGCGRDDGAQARPAAAIESPALGALAPRGQSLPPDSPTASDFDWHTARTQGDGAAPHT